MSKEIKTFGNTEVKKHKFHQHKSPISIYDVNIYRTVVSNKLSLGKKGFEHSTGYENDHEKVMSLCIILPKISASRRDLDQTKYMSF